MKKKRLERIAGALAQASGKSEFVLSPRRQMRPNLECWFQNRNSVLHPPAPGNKGFLDTGPFFRHHRRYNPKQKDLP
jgi:hypothetical protein